MFSPHKSDFLMLQLSELVGMCFMAATSDTDQLRLESLLIMQVVIDKFGQTAEAEFLGYVKTSYWSSTRLSVSG